MGLGSLMVTSEAPRRPFMWSLIVHAAERPGVIHATAPTCDTMRPRSVRTASCRDVVRIAVPATVDHRATRSTCMNRSVPVTSTQK